MFNRLRAVFRPSTALPAVTPRVEAPADIAPVEESRPARIPPHMRHINRSMEEHLSVYQTARIIPSNDIGVASTARRRRRAA